MTTSLEQQLKNIEVFVRICPQTSSNNCILQVNKTNNSIQISRPNNLEESRTFTFSRIFDEKTTQKELFKSTTLPVVQKILKGYNGTVFAYGQSGTGKTHTIIGEQQRHLWGLVPNAFSQIFHEISLSKDHVSYVITATFLEIYNEKIRDLLSSNSNLPLSIRERSDLGVYVKNLSGFTVDSLETVYDLLKRGSQNRVTQETALNQTSSRSHAIFTVSVETKDHKTNQTSFGKLNLVDLAGSERVNKTQATGLRLKEATKINLSLSMLGKVISSLIKNKSGYIPYRNSKLTRLLKDSLGGNSLTSMIALISPLDKDFEESLCTLRYANGVKNIKNFVKVNMEKLQLIESFEAKINALKEQLSKLLTPCIPDRLTRRTSSKLALIKKQQKDLSEKLQTIQKKILIGGVNLLEKASQQQILLEDRDQELQVLNSSQTRLQEKLFEKNQELCTINKNFFSLKREDEWLTEELTKTTKLLKESRLLLLREESKYQKEIATLLELNKHHARQLGLANLIVNYFIPKEDLRKIKEKLCFDEELQQWSLQGVAYTGNNLRK